jgi:predicted phosphodiesterase
VRLLLMSDTHLPKRAKELPAQLLAELPRADVVFHAGDWVDTATLDLLESRSRRFVGVYGNNDGPELRARLPEVAYAELGGLRFGAVHETGSAQGREARPASPTWTCWSSDTATSPGTPRPRPACACSTRAPRPTADASRTART